MLGPFGHGFDAAAAGPRPLLVGGGFGAALLAPLSQRLPAAALLAAFRDADAARAAELVPAAEREIALPPANVLELLAPRLAGRIQRVRRRARRPRARRRRGLRGARACLPGRARGADGLRLRRLLRLRGAARRSARAALRRGPGRGRRAPGGGVSADLATRVGALELEHPVMNASGTLDPLAARDAGLAIDRELALLVTKTVTPLAREGNEAPRVCEVAGGMLNSIGLPNPGLDDFAANGAARGARARAAARRVDRRLRARRLRARLPPPRRRGRHRGARAQRLLPERQERLHLDRQRSRRDRGGRARSAAPRRGLPLWVKLSPNVADLAAIAARRRARRRRRAGAHEHAARRSRSTTGRSSRCSAASPAGSPARRSSPWRWPRSTPAARPAPCRIVGVGGHRERVGCARIPRCGRKRRAGRAARPSASRCSPGASARNSPPYSLSAA